MEAKKTAHKKGGESNSWLSPGEEPTKREEPGSNSS
eukprot:CAMPEP_0172168118 /NCGR_PEP_ID=MMETSP1050-20130122/9955_1 /TAXON_ID=233186 /ORGANISM="Cryptomonas curvata, Strain CCAP979/52" /LENGTH=35 /DNA_ID= /DNA_START= /DNA_END= /DNA_ORIENTATION=